MKMIIGGAHQGKLSYGKELYPERVWVDGSKCEFDEIEKCGGIYYFQEYIRRLMEKGQEKVLKELPGQLLKSNPDVIIISDEIGYGLVPIDRFERVFRETVGRVCTEIAANSDRVDRVVCGIGHIMKGKEE